MQRSELSVHYRYRGLGNYVTVIPELRSAVSKNETMVYKHAV